MFDTSSWVLLESTDCDSEDCQHRGECANHVTAGDYRSEAGPSPALRLYEGKLYCTSYASPPDETYRRPANSTHSGYVYLKDGCLYTSTDSDATGVVSGDGTYDPADCSTVITRRCEDGEHEVAARGYRCSSCQEIFFIPLLKAGIKAEWCPYCMGVITVLADVSPPC